MAINLRPATQKDQSEWNKIVENDPQGNFFDRFEWCQGLGAISERIKPLPLFIEENGKTVGVFPSCLVRSRLWKSFESLPYSDYGGGPFFRRKVSLEHPASFAEFVNRLIDLGLQNHCLNISIRRAYFKDLINEEMIRQQIITDKNTCSFIISLREGIDHVHKSLEKNRRIAIREGRGRGLVVRLVRNSNDLREYYEIYLRTMNRLKSAPFPYGFFEYVWNTFNPKGEVQILVAEWNDKIIAGILQFIYKNVCHWFGNVSLEEYRRRRPTDLLLWHSIEHAIEESIEFLDMGSTPNDSMSGHYFFKKSWGGTKITLHNYQILLQPMKWRLGKLASRVHSLIASQKSF